MKILILSLSCLGAFTFAGCAHSCGCCCESSGKSAHHAGCCEKCAKGACPVDCKCEKCAAAKKAK